MALRFSTGARDMILGQQPEITALTAGAINSLTFATGSPSTITRSGGSFITDGWVAGDKMRCDGATTPGNDTGLTDTLVAIVAAELLTLADAVVDTGEIFAAATVICAGKGGSLKDIFRNGCLYLYSGSQPSSADNAVTGTQLLKVTQASGAFAHGAEANGIEFGDYAGGYIEKCADEVWSGVGLAAGTAGYFLLVANPTDNLALSTVLPRISGSVGTSGADLNLATTSIAVDQTVTIDTFKITLPAYYGA